MIKKYNKRSFFWAVPGLILQTVGGLSFIIFPNIPLDTEAFFCALIGFILVAIGFTFYVRAKARHFSWAFLALLSWPGFILLAMLKDKHKQATERMHAGLCPACGYDLRNDFAAGCSECGWERKKIEQNM